MFDRLSSAEGLPNSHVIAMVQDTIGFMWFGTQDGLARYDGARMKVFRPIENNPASLSASYITALELDEAGRIWVGTAEQGVNVYDPKKDEDRFTRYQTGAKGGLSSVGVTAIHRDQKNRMWFAMTGGGLNRFVPETSTFTPYLTETAVTALDSDAKGSLWLGNGADGVIKWNPDDGSTAAFPLTDDTGGAAAPVTSVLVAANGTVWIGTEGAGVVAFDPVTLKAVRYRSGPDASSISSDHITDLFEDRQNNIWFGTISGLNKISKAGAVEQFHHDANDPKSLGFEGVESIYQDSGGVIWAGGFVHGLSKFDELQSQFGRHRTRTHPPVSFYEDEDDSVWVGTYHGGLWKFDWKKGRSTIWTTFGTPGSEDSIPLETAWIPSVHRDRSGTLWVSLQGQGVVAFDTKTEAFKRYGPDQGQANGLPVDTVWDILEDSKGRLWFATWGGGLVRYEKATDSFTAFTTESVSGMSSDHLYALQLDPQDPKIMWIASAKGGLIRFDVEGISATSFRYKNDPKSLSSDDVLSIYVDGTGSVWAGTYGGGLNRVTIATGVVQRFTTSNSGMANDVVFGILPDNDGSLWMSTNGGLVQFKAKDNKFTVYTVADGLQGNEFGQNAYMRSRSGKLYFGGVEGMNAFDPKAIKRDAFAPPVVLTGFKLSNSEVKLGRPIWTLPNIDVSYSDAFEIEFAALSYAAPEKNRYAFKLEGYDSAFIETDRPFASYKKLPGGDYVLRVKTANRHGVWNEQGVALNVSVTPPFWFTWPAYIGYIVILVGLVVLIVYLQRQRVRRVVREGRLAVVERDLALTGAVQSGFLPEHNETVGPHVHLYGFYQAADACSGDWWWHENLSGRHAVLVGDVTGHGPGPAMVTAAVATAFRVLCEAGLTDLNEALAILNRVVLQVGKGKYSMTMAALEINEFTGEWVLLSAGAPPMITVGVAGKHKTLFCAGTPLGTEGVFEPGHLQGRLTPNERILLYTDGIPEITLPNGKPLGLRRLGQVVERTQDKQLSDVAAEIVSAATQAQGGMPQDDDWTFTILEWQGSVS